MKNTVLICIAGLASIFILAGCGGGGGGSAAPNTETQRPQSRVITCTNCQPAQLQALGAETINALPGTNVTVTLMLTDTQHAEVLAWLNSSGNLSNAPAALCEEIVYESHADTHGDFNNTHKWAIVRNGVTLHADGRQIHGRHLITMTITPVAEAENARQAKISIAETSRAAVRAAAAATLTAALAGNAANRPEVHRALVSLNAAYTVTLRTIRDAYDNAVFTANLNYRIRGQILSSAIDSAQTKLDRTRALISQSRPAAIRNAPTQAARSAVAARYNTAWHAAFDDYQNELKIANTAYRDADITRDRALAAAANIRARDIAANANAFNANVTVIYARFNINVNARANYNAAIAAAGAAYAAAVSAANTEYSSARAVNASVIGKHNARHNNLSVAYRAGDIIRVLEQGAHGELAAGDYRAITDGANFRIAMPITLSDGRRADNCNAAPTARQYYVLESGDNAWRSDRGFAFNMRGILADGAAIQTEHFLFAHADNMRDLHMELRASPITLHGVGIYADTGFKWENNGETQAHYGKLMGVYPLLPDGEKSPALDLYASTSAGKVHSDYYENSRLQGFATGFFARRFLQHNDEWHVRVRQPLAAREIATWQIAADARIGAPDNMLSIGYYRELHGKSGATILWRREF